MNKQNQYLLTTFKKDPEILAFVLLEFLVLGVLFAAALWLFFQIDPSQFSDAIFKNFGKFLLIGFSVRWLYLLVKLFFLSCLGSLTLERFKGGNPSMVSTFLQGFGILPFLVSVTHQKFLTTAFLSPSSLHNRETFKWVNDVRESWHLNLGTKTLSVLIDFYLDGVALWGASQKKLPIKVAHSEFLEFFKSEGPRFLVFGASLLPRLGLLFTILLTASLVLALMKNPWAILTLGLFFIILNIHASWMLLSRALLLPRIFYVWDQNRKGLWQPEKAENFFQEIGFIKKQI